MNQRLYRSESNRILGGVCAGLGEYLGIDPLFPRIFFVIWTIVGGFSIMVYLVLWVVMPSRTSSGSDGKFHSEELGARIRQVVDEIRWIVQQPSPEFITYAGVGLIGWGVYQLLPRLNLPWDIMRYEEFLWPALLILIGIIILVRAVAQKK